MVELKKVKKKIKKSVVELKKGFIFAARNNYMFSESGGSLTESSRGNIEVQNELKNYFKKN